MKFKIFKEKQEWKEKEKEVYLKLREDSDGDVILIAVDEDGCPILGGYILDVSPTKGVCLRMSVNEEIGLPLDSNGSVIICK